MPVPSHQSVQLHARETCFEGFFSVERLTLSHRKFDGDWTQPLTREIHVRRRAVAVLPYDPVLDKVVLIEQFRPGAYRAGLEPWLFEVPAGIIDPGEADHAVARREMREETGLALDDMGLITRFLPSPGASSEVVTCIYGRTDSAEAGGIHGMTAEGEDIRVTAWPVDEAFEALDAGTFINAPTIICLMWLRANRERLCSAGSLEARDA